MKNNLKYYSNQTGDIASFHKKYDLDFLNVIESLLSEYPNIYEYLIIDKNIGRAIRNYLERYLSSKSIEFESILILLDIDESSVNRMLNEVCKILGVAIFSRIIFSVASNPSKNSVIYGNLESHTKQNGENETATNSIESKIIRKRKNPFD